MNRASIGIKDLSGGHRNAHPQTAHRKEAESVSELKSNEILHFSLLLEKGKPGRLVLDTSLWVTDIYEIWSSLIPTTDYPPSVWRIRASCSSLYFNGESQVRFISSPHRGSFPLQIHCLPLMLRFEQLYR